MSVHHLEMSDLEFEPPQIDLDVLARVARDAYGITAAMKRLDGERDQNLLLDTGDDNRFLLKVSGAAEAADAVELQVQVLVHLEHHAPHLPLPRVLPALDGSRVSRFTDCGGKSHHVRLLTFVPGETFANEHRLADSTLWSIGRFMGEVSAALSDFGNPVTPHFMPWDLANGLIGDDALWVTAGEDLAAVTRGGLRETLVNDTLPALGRQRHQVIYNDCHAGNLLRHPGTYEIAGLIDFGDIAEAPLVNELAVTSAAFSHRGTGTAPDAVVMMAKGFHSAHPLTESEIDLLYDAITARHVQSTLLFDFQLFHSSRHAYVADTRAQAMSDLIDWIDCDQPALTDRLNEELLAHDG